MKDYEVYSIPQEQFKFIEYPERSGWTCYLFGSKGYGLTYKPAKGDVPNRFIRWMMKVCFACTWVKDEK